MNVLEVYNMMLSDYELKLAKKELMTKLFMLLFFLLMAILMLAIAYFVILPELMMKKNYWVILFIVPLSISFLLPYFSYISYKKSARQLNKARGLHWEGIVLAKYSTGRNGLYFKVLIGDRELSVGTKYKHILKPGNRVCIVTLDDGNDWENYTFLDCYFLNEEDSIWKKGVKKDRIHSVDINDSNAFENKPYRDKIMRQWKTKYRNKDLGSLEEYLERI